MNFLLILNYLKVKKYPWQSLNLKSACIFSQSINSSKLKKEPINLKKIKISPKSFHVKITIKTNLKNTKLKKSILKFFY